MKRLIAACVLLFGAAGAGVYVMQHSASQAVASGKDPQHSAQQEVAVLPLQLQQIHVQRSLPGRVRAFRQSVVRPQVDGLITQRMFEEGAEVEQGQQLYQIDDSRYRATLSRALADLNSAQANYAAVQARSRRYAELINKNAISKQEYDDVVAGLGQAEAEIGVAKANVELAQVDVEYTKVYAPIAGRISRSYVSEGSLVTANQQQELATITALDPVYVDMQRSISEADVVDLQTAQSNSSHIPVQLFLEKREGAVEYALEGELKFAEVTMDESTASITLRAVIPNPDGQLLPGMFVRAVMDLGPKQALLIPQRATTRTSEGTLTAWVVDTESKARKRAIEVSEAYQDNWVVTKGIEPGEKLIVEGYQKVDDGEAVVTTGWLQAASEKIATAH